MKLVTKVQRIGNAGFTLVELLVVIAIITLLATAGLMNYRNSLEQGRDARRVGDMKSVQTAFEQYYTENGDYADPCDNMALGTLPRGLPQDPISGLTYSYICTPTVNYDYCVCASLEKAGNGNAVDANCTYGAGDFFCVSNLQ